ncbi:MAG: amidohydrolase [Firmicutes bacterium]|nr:amidohydrolase [Bacillota bacterium]
MVIDFHTHCFPDKLARRAIAKLEESAGEKAYLDGTVSGLLRSMDRAGIDLSILQPVATRPGQERSINEWAWACTARAPGRILSFGSIHPDSRDWRDEIRRIADYGLKGVKFHPDYQEFYVDEPRVFPVYEALCAEGLVILFHAGIDIGLPEPCHCPPERLRKVIQRLPEGKWVAAHMGGWRCWDEVEAGLVGQPLYFDTSYSYPWLGAARMRSLILAHGVDRILFGTDSPWADQAQAVAEIHDLGLPLEMEKTILGGNAAALLGLGANSNGGMGQD